MANSNSNIAGILNIRAKSGDSFIRDFTFTTDDTVPVPIDLTGYNVKLQIRESADKTQRPVLAADLSNYMSIGGASNNVISIEVAGELMRFPPKIYMWDLELVSPSNVTTTYLEGSFKLEKDISQ